MIRMLKSYGFTIVLICSIIAGSVIGLVLKEKAAVLKPLGDIFLNLLFTIVVPMVFFSLSSAVASMSDGKRLGKILAAMITIFLITAIISASLMAFVVQLVPPAQGVKIDLPAAPDTSKGSLASQIVGAFTVEDFPLLISKRNMLALILFSILTGLAASQVRQKAKPFIDFLSAGNLVMTRLMGIIMRYAPIGLGAYFAYLVGVFGPQLLGSYFRTVAIYYPVALAYFFIGFTLYAFIAAGTRGVVSFWKNIIPAALTAWATGSSIAAVPTNLESARRIGVPEDIREVVIPIGATIHMDGSCLAAVLKIALLFGLFGMDFSGIAAITAVGAAILAGIVMSGIPGGGFLGELMIVTLYGFPPQALPLISMVGQLVDPPGTMVNSSGDTVASMLTARALEGPNWMKSQHQ